MDECKMIARLQNKIIAIGGQQHSGWLPAGASEPVTVPVQSVSFNFEIQFDGSGYLLCYVSEKGDLYGDTWHESLQEAQQVAFDRFGVQFEEWHHESSEV